MSRTIQEIYNGIITEKETYSSLDGLTPNPETAVTFIAALSSGSKVAIWRLYTWLIAFAIWTHEQIFDEHVLQIEARAQEIVPGVIRWWTDQAKNFQLGYELTWNLTTGKYEYSDTTSVAAEASKIITQSSALEVNNNVQLKVAKGTIGSLEKLTASELTSFTDYVEKFAFAGISKTIISADPDYLKAYYLIEYEPTILTSSGLLIADGVTYPVIDAILDFIQELNFNSKLRVTDLTDAIQQAQGVVNCVATDIQASSDNGSTYTDVLAVATQTFQSYAGYFIIDPSFPTSTTLTYQAAS